MLTGLNVVIIPQYIDILNHYVIYLKLYLKYNSIKKKMLNPILDQQITWDVLQKQTKYHSTGKLSKSGENTTTTEKNQKRKPDWRGAHNPNNKTYKEMTQFKVDIEFWKN